MRSGSTNCEDFVQTVPRRNHRINKNGRRTNSLATADLFSFPQKNSAFSGPSYLQRQLLGSEGLRLEGRLPQDRGLGQQRRHGVRVHVRRRATVLQVSCWATRYRLQFKDADYQATAHRCQQTTSIIYARGLFEFYLGCHNSFSAPQELGLPNVLEFYLGHHNSFSAFPTIAISFAEQGGANTFALCLSLSPHTNRAATIRDTLINKVL